MKQIQVQGYATLCCTAVEVAKHSSAQQASKTAARKMFLLCCVMPSFLRVIRSVLRESVVSYGRLYATRVAMAYFLIPPRARM